MLATILCIITAILLARLRLNIWHVAPGLRSVSWVPLWRFLSTCIVHTVYTTDNKPSMSSHNEIMILLTGNVLTRPAAGPTCMLTRLLMMSALPRLYQHCNYVWIMTTMMWQWFSLHRWHQQATSQLVTRSSRHTVMSSLGQLVTGQLITDAFFSQSHLVTRSSRHTVISTQAIIVQSYG